MRILLTGASGLLGRQVYQALKKSTQNDVTGTCFKRTKDGSLTTLDITDENQLSNIFDKLQPKVVIHCAAERRPDVVEKSASEAQAVNVKGTQMICSLAKRNSCWVLYVSTDYVFDGKNAPYSVDDSPNPMNAYGRMKLGGERCTLESNPDNAVLRVPILYGPVEFLGESAVTVLYEKVRNLSQSCSLDHRQRRFPTHTDNVADIISQMVDRHVEKPFSVRGIYHFAEPAMFTKYDMGICMAEAKNLNTSHIQADTSEPPSNATPRPYDCQLDTSKLVEQGFKLKSSEFKAAVSSLLS